MDVFLLGAGKPAFGQKPSALKNIALNTRAMDWQIQSFEQIANPDALHYLGGYDIDNVIKNYPQLNFTVIPDWQNKSILHTFLKAPFTGNSVIVSYSDTIFRKEVLDNMLSLDADIIFCVDSLWKERYELRTTEDIELAETIKIKNETGQYEEQEFTGLIHFNKKAVSYFSDIIESEVGSNLIHLLEYLQEKGLTVKSYNVSGNWAELNSPRDITQFILGTKAETLSRLENLVCKSHIGKQVSFTTAHWHENSKSILDKISSCFVDSNIIIRSSAKSEDNWNTSNAGNYASILNIDTKNRTDVSNAVNSVIASYKTKLNDDDQILVQRFIKNVSAAGVVFTCGLETGSPYYRFNFDDKTQSTESVTAGSHSDLRTIILSRYTPNYLNKLAPELLPVLEAVKELEQLLSYDKLDVEFAIDNTGQVHIFQVRPIAVDHSRYEFESDSIKSSLNDSVLRFKATQVHQPYVYGHKTVFANMPDWNPAEIIGTHPKPLAFSLYRYLITNDIWALQRTEFGYRDVRPNPLILSFSGQPYVDARISINSFIPASLSDKTAETIANAYINILSDNPQLHDKIEFDIAFTIWTPNFIEIATNRLKPYKIKSEHILQLEEALKIITLNAFTRLQRDIKSIDELNKRREKIESLNISKIDKIFSLLNDCKYYGTLAFSHAARAGFVATTILNSFVSNKIITNQQKLSFLKSVVTVAGELDKDRHAYKKGQLSEKELIEKYGHLRPGTYEIEAQAYWEDPSRYLNSEHKQISYEKSDFKFSTSEKNKFKTFLNELGSSLSAEDLINYMMEAIRIREFVKFEFTKNISHALDFCIELADELNISRSDFSYLDYNDLEQLKLNTISIEGLKSNIELRKKNHALTGAIELPPVIQEVEDFYCFERFTSQPNFITINKVEAAIIQLAPDIQNDLSGKVVLINQADPGYDWLFSYDIAALITKYGGANSHMAIRAAELDLPAAIGVGDELYEIIAHMRRIELDCSNHTIREIQ